MSVALRVGFGFCFGRAFKTFFHGQWGSGQGVEGMSFKEYEGQIQSCDRKLPVAVAKGFNFSPLSHIPVIKTPT